MAEPKAPIGKRGIALENILKHEWGPAYIEEIGLTRIQAVENIKKYSEIIIVDEENKAVEYRSFEARTKAWNFYRLFNVPAGQYQEVVEVFGEGEIVCVSIYTEGSGSVQESFVEVYMDREIKPSFKATLKDLYVLGGCTAPTPNPNGGATVWNTTSHLYGGFASLNSSFTQRCKITVYNADTTAARNIKVAALFRLRGTEVKVWTSSGVEGSTSGDTPPPTSSGEGVVGSTRYSRIIGVPI